MAGRSGPVKRVLGRAPADDELEVTVLGCGYGESIVVHRGNNRWFVIDSFVHKTATDDGIVERTSAALAYLTAIGVEPSHVDDVFLSHYHEDHSAGLQFLAEATDARFHWPPPLNRNGSGPGSGKDRDFRAVEAVLDELVAADERRSRVGVSNLRDARVALGQRRARIASKIRVYPNKPPINGVLKVLAPVGEYQNREFPGIAKRTRRAEKDRNLSSLVLQLTVDGVSVIFGADLENDARLGWAGVVRDEVNDRVSGGTVTPLATLVKIPHHGSRGSVHLNFYDELVDRSAIAILTTQDRGSTNLPDEEAARLAPERVARVVHVGSPLPTSTDGMTAAQRKTEHVTFRRRLGEEQWRDVHDGVQVL